MLDVSTDGTLCIHSTGLWLITRVQTLTTEANLVQVTLAIKQATGLANSGMTVGVLWTISCELTWCGKWSAPNGNIICVSIVAFVAFALGFVSLWFALGIWTTRDIFTDILALWNALNLAALGVSWAIVIAGTFNGRTTSFTVWISNESTRTVTSE